MRVALSLTLAGPLWGALISLAGGGSARSCRSAASLGVLGGIGGAIALLAGTVSSGGAAERGFEADAWRAGLALGTLLVVGAFVARSDAPAALNAVALVGAGAGVAAIFAPDMTGVAGGSLVVSLAVATAAWMSPSDVSLARARWLLIADVVAIGSLAAGSAHGVSAPLEVEGVAALGIVAAVGLRALISMKRGATPVGGDATASLMRGPVVAHTLLLVGSVGVGSGGRFALAIVGAVIAVVGARRSLVEASTDGAHAALLGLAFVGVGIGGSAGAYGAVVIAAGAFLGSVMTFLGATHIARATIASAPLGATLPGAALVVTAALARVPSDRGLALVAMPAALSLAWLVVAGVAGTFDAAWRRRPSVALLALPSIAVAAVVVLPSTTVRLVGDHAAGALGTARPLTETVGAMPDELGVVFALAAAVVLLARLPSRTDRVDSPSGDGAGADVVVAIAPVHALTSYDGLPRLRALPLLAGAAVLTWIVLFVRASGRGFL